MYAVNMANPGPEFNDFHCTDGILDDLDVALSRERLGTYLDRTGSDLAAAIRLHVRNTAICAAFHGPLQGLEVALRNAMNCALGERYGADWHDNACAGFDRGALERIARARAELERAGHRHEPHRVAAALSFGFWVSLLVPGGRLATAGRANHEMTLWRAAPRDAFPHRVPLTRRQVHRPLNAFRTLRNRIAHHEPTLARNLVEGHERILKVAGWISPTTRAWIEHHSRVPAALDNAGDAGDVRF
ncbi:MAG: hypothetical protein OXH79_08635 [Boseongicola sp.]|nr:hypothetical protein [Boseongicola sp.]